MDISCDIIRDLLPLYAENLVSEDSRKLVDEHLCTCDPCTKQLGILKKAAQLPIEVETTSLKRVEDTIRRRRLLTVAAALMTVASIIVTAIVWLFTPYALTAKEAVEGVELREDGGLAIDFARGIQGHAGRGVFDVNNYGHICHTNRYDWYQAKQMDKQLEGMSREELEAHIEEFYDIEECTQSDWDRFFNISVDYGTWESPNGEHHYYPYFKGDFDESQWKQTYKPTNRNHWYLNPVTGDGDLLMWDGGKDMPTSIIWMSTYAYGYAFWGSLILAAFCYIISRGITGIWNDILTRMTIILVCVAASILLVTGGQLTTLEYYLSNDWTETAYLEALVLSLTALLWHQLHRLNRQDKGM